MSGVQRSGSSYPRVLLERNPDFHAVIKVELDDIQSEPPENPISIFTASPTSSSSSNLIIFPNVEEDNRCEICSRKCSDATTLQLHINLYHNLTTVSNDDRRNEGQVKCQECQLTFDKKETLWLHQSEVHKKLVCTKCGKWFYKRCQLVHHLEYHKFPSTEWKWKCVHCTKKFPTEQQLEGHLNTHGGKNSPKTTFKSGLKRGRPPSRKQKKRKCECQECGKVYASQWDLTQHLRLHTGERSFPCHLCEDRFFSRQHLKRHLQGKRAVAQNETFKCEICDAKFEEENLRTHQTEIHSKQVDIEGEQIVAVKKKALPKRWKNVERDPRIWKWQCKECGFRCVAEWKLNLHLRTHSGERPYPCHLCPRRCSYSHNLKEHLQRIHGIARSSAVKFIQCTECDAKFRKEENLRKHQNKKHSKHVCKKCGKVFQLGKDLQKHLENAHGEESKDWKWECRECGKRCVSEFKLIQHMGGHTGQRLHACHLCEQRFSLSNHLTHHLQVKHGVVDGPINAKSILGRSSLKNDGSSLTCQFCGKIFPSQRNLMAHCISQHGDEIGKGAYNISSTEENESENLNENRNDADADESTVDMSAVDIKPSEILEDPLEMDVSYEQADIPTEETVIETQRVDNDETVTCHFCSRLFWNRRNLMEHCKSQHGDEIEKLSESMDPVEGNETGTTAADMSVVDVKPSDNLEQHPLEMIGHPGQCDLSYENVPQSSELPPFSLLDEIY